MDSDVTIANTALMRVGVSQLIDDLADETTEATLLNEIFASVRDRVLRARPWPFARKDAALALVEDDPTTEWAYSYRYPSDCVFLRRIYSGLYRQDPRRTQVPYLVASDATGLLLYTDMEEAWMEYTWRLTNPVLMPDDFCSAFAWLLASEIAIPLGRDAGREYRNDALRQYAMEITTASSAGFNEQTMDDDPPSEFISARD